MRPSKAAKEGHTRPVLKIQDGCDSRCSYCVIPQVRGRSRSLAPDRVIEEIRKLSHRGAREVVLSGIDLGNYGRDLHPRTQLVSVLRRILDETPVERLRVSSIEPMDVTEDLIGPVRGERPPGAALPHAVAVGIGPHSGGDAPVVSRRTLRSARGTGARVAPRRGDWRGCDRRISRRDRRRSPRNARANRADTAHVPARLFILTTAGNSRGGHTGSRCERKHLAASARAARPGRGKDNRRFAPRKLDARCAH